MRLLIIGGTGFVGRALAGEALAAGHRVTTVNRGRTGPDVPGVEAVRGDRTSRAALAALVRGRDWDAVADTSGYVPAHAGLSAAALDGHAGAYLFVSSVAAYRRDGPLSPMSGDETAPLHDCPPDATTGPYGILQAGCERAVTAHFTGSVHLLRPGAIVGPGEDTGQSVFWLRRFADGAPLLAPGDPRAPLPLVDARDLAGFALTLAGKEPAGGAWNVAGPRDTDQATWVAAWRAATGGREPVWIPDRFLLDHGVRPWVDLPWWVPGAAPGRSVWGFSTSRAEAAGLVCRPPAETARDTWRWLHRTIEVRQRPDQPAPGLTRAAELALIETWSASRGPDTGNR